MDVDQDATYADLGNEILDQEILSSEINKNFGILSILLQSLKGKLLYKFCSQMLIAHHFIFIELAREFLVCKQLSMMEETLIKDCPDSFPIDENLPIPELDPDYFAEIDEAFEEFINFVYEPDNNHNNQ
jgi:hypothetical protein